MNSRTISNYALKVSEMKRQRLKISGTRHRNEDMKTGQKSFQFQIKLTRQNISSQTFKFQRLTDITDSGIADIKCNT